MAAGDGFFAQHKLKLIIGGVVLLLLIIAAILIAVIPFPVKCQDLTINEVQPAQILCLAEEEVPLQILGDGFMQIDKKRSKWPTVTFDDSEIDIQEMDSEQCKKVYSKGHHVLKCKQILTNLPNEGDDSETRESEITVTNADPCKSKKDQYLVYIIEKPTITEVNPPAICISGLNPGPRTFIVNGTGFASIGGNFPLITANQSGMAVNITVNNMVDCGEAVFPDQDVYICPAMNVTIIVGDTTGTIDLWVTNDHIYGCSAELLGAIEFLPPPNATDVQPREFCYDQGGELQITGYAFGDGTQVRLDRVSDNFQHLIPNGQTTLVSDTVLNFTVNPNEVADGFYRVTLINGDCVTVTDKIIQVHPIVVVFFLDPPVTYSGIKISGTVYTSGLERPNATVKLVHSNGNENVSIPDARPQIDSLNRLDLTIPSGLTAGQWHVEVRSAIGCVGVLDNGLDVISALTVNINNISPKYIYTSDPATGVVVTGSGFVETPRVFLNPPVTDALSVPMRAVVYSSATSFNGVVNDGLAPGSYDVVVINPDKTVGFAADLLTITAQPTPYITSISPDSYANIGTGRAVGANFVNGSTAATSSRFVLDCVAPDGTVVAAFNNRTLTYTYISSTAVDLAIPIDSSVVQATVCTVTVTNPDRSFFVFSAISKTSSSGNLVAWRNRTAFNDARKGHVSAILSPAGSKYLYVIGGDQGNLTSNAPVLTGVEAAQLDNFGRLGTWSRLPASALPAARTFHKSGSYQRFVYVLGGLNSQGQPTNTVWKSQVLDPLNTPTLDVTLNLVNLNESNLQPGLFYYRVSATFPSNDPVNPSGESLPGEILTLQIPNIPEALNKAPTLTLTWDPIARATGYRVYKTPSAGSDPSTLALLGTTSTTDFTDDGMATPDSQQTPLPVGSIGKWATLPPLNVARSGHGAVVTPSSLNPNEVFLYVFGGTNGTLLSSYEYIKGTVVGDDHVFSGSWTLVEGFLTTARTNLNAITLVQKDVPLGIFANETYVFIGSGKIGASNTREIILAPIQYSNGQLITGQKLVGSSTDDEGYALYKANEVFYYSGLDLVSTAANSGTVGNNGRVGGGCSSNCFPSLNNWNSDPQNIITEPRKYPGFAQNAVYFYQTGGFSGTTNTVRNTVDANIR